MTFIKFVPLVLVIGKFSLLKRVPKRPDARHQRILIVRMDGLGDFLLTTPFLRELRHNFPASHITILTGSNVADLANMCPYVDKVETINLARLKFFNLPEVAKFTRASLYSKFDFVLLPRWDIDCYWATLIACLSGAPRIVAHTRKTTARKALFNWGYDSLVTDALPKGNLQHEKDRALEIISYLGGTITSRTMEIWWSTSDEAEADRFVDTLGSSARQKPWIALGIVASKGRKSWPYFADFLDEMNHAMSFIPFLFVAPNELEKANHLKLWRPECVVVCQPLRVAAAIMSRCKAFVGNDSGPLHMAAAVGLPSVEICCHPKDGDPTHEYSPARFGHLGQRGRVVQPASGIDNCSASCVEHFAHCISLVKPQEVILSIESLLEESA